VAASEETNDPPWAIELLRDAELRGTLLLASHQRQLTSVTNRKYRHPLWLSRIARPDGNPAAAHVRSAGKAVAMWRGSEDGRQVFAAALRSPAARV